jgi:CHRD domain
VPPNASAAGASLKAQYSKETQILKFQLIVNGLSSPITRASFHGPDSLGADAALAPINTPFNGTYQAGGTTLTPTQAADLLAGRWSIEIQTEQFPEGEIRGQIVKTGR